MRPEIQATIISRSDNRLFPGLTGHGTKSYGRMPGLPARSVASGAAKKILAGRQQRPERKSLALLATLS